MLVRAATLRRQQPRARDGDASLVGRGRQDLEVLLVERVRFAALDDQHSDRHIVDSQRDVHLGAAGQAAHILLFPPDVRRVMEFLILQRPLGETLSLVDSLRHIAPAGARLQHAIPRLFFKQIDAEEAVADGLVAEAGDDCLVDLRLVVR